MGDDTDPHACSNHTAHRMMTLDLNANIQSHTTGGRNVGHESMKVATNLQTNERLTDNQVGKCAILCPR